MFITVIVSNLRPQVNSKLIETPGGLVRVEKKSQADELNSEQVLNNKVFTDHCSLLDPHRRVLALGRFGMD